MVQVVVQLGDLLMLLVVQVILLQLVHLKEIVVELVALVQVDQIKVAVAVVEPEQ